MAIADSGEIILVWDNNRKVSAKFHLSWFHEKYNNVVWLPDAILKIIFLKAVRKICKNWVIQGPNLEVYAECHLCSIKDKHFKNERIIQNGCQTPSWISLSPLHLKILSRTNSLMTSIGSYVPISIFALWSFMIFWKIWY